VMMSLIYEDGMNVSIKILLSRNLLFLYVIEFLCENH